MLRPLTKFSLILLLVLGAMLPASAQTTQTETEALNPLANVEYPAPDGTLISGYLAMPELEADGMESEAQYPAVLMVHEWWGLNAEIVEMAEILAAEGYIVLAADTYRGAVATTVPAALLLRTSVDEERVDGDMQAAFDYLLTFDQVDPERIGVMGFCYGGGVAMRFATLNADIAATVNLYGDLISNPEGFGALLESGKPLLGIFGAEDMQIPLSEVEAFAAALAETDIPHEVTIYDGVGHAFVKPDALEEDGAPAEAWAQILAFFEDALKNPDEA
jgi:carboxymethylenebutenolidase